MTVDKIKFISGHEKKDEVCPHLSGEYNYVRCGSDYSSRYNYTETDVGVLCKRKRNLNSNKERRNRSRLRYKKHRRRQLIACIAFVLWLQEKTRRVTHNTYFKTHQHLTGTEMP